MAIIFGTNGKDVLVGGDGVDFIFGLNDDDVLFGRGDNDSLFGGEGDDVLNGGSGNDVLVGGDGDDTIAGLSGDDVIITGEGRDEIEFDPSNVNEGNDVITDFSLPSELDPEVGDFLSFRLEELLAADPDLPAADGDASSLSIEDFDASENWTFGSSDDGNLLLAHPGGTVEFTNAEFNNLPSVDLGSVILIDGEEFDEPIPLDTGEDAIA